MNSASAHVLQRRSFRLEITGSLSASGVWYEGKPWTTQLLPQSYHYALGILAVALLYAVSFNWIMAVYESRYLERYFGEEYRRYGADVPFVIPLIRLKKEVKS